MSVQSVYFPAGECRLQNGGGEIFVLVLGLNDAARHHQASAHHKGVVTVEAFLAAARIEDDRDSPLFAPRVAAPGP